MKNPHGKNCGHLLELRAVSGKWPVSPKGPWSSKHEEMNPANNLSEFDNKPIPNQAPR